MRRGVHGDGGEGDAAAGVHAAAAVDQQVALRNGGAFGLVEGDGALGLFGDEAGDEADVALDQRGQLLVLAAPTPPRVSSRSKWVSAPSRAAARR
ncbi:MAG: hypothetical protein P8098_03300 [Candidatus Thiodiazotropha sp.]